MVYALYVAVLDMVETMMSLWNYCMDAMMATMASHVVTPLGEMWSSSLRRYYALKMFMGMHMMTKLWEQ